MQQYIYFPEPNASHNTKIVSVCLLYILPLSIILTSLGVCLYKQRQKHSTDYLFKLKADQMNKGVVQQPTYGQSKVTDIALTALLLSCYLPYVVLMLVDIAYPREDGENGSSRNSKLKKELLSLPHGLYLGIFSTVKRRIT